ncbi:MAG TPA: FAD-dependent oxidoreductase, partial [Steroidobacteraceae bacterium]|nr:FAD-dependent oxidoreductase [Steroidobacteraceae bacterium]
MGPSVGMGAPARPDFASTPLARDEPHCLYVATARAAVSTPPLRADARTEVAVIGAGYTGISTALHLAERGVAVTLLEAREPGWGAAGRNGGQVNAGLKHEPDEVERALGAVYGPRLVRLAGEAPGLLFALIARLGIDCEARRAGTLRVAHHPRHAGMLRDSVEQWRRRGAALEFWDAAATKAATGTGHYVAAAFDP